jgi:acetolactate synthase-1/3 small subunit
MARSLPFRQLVAQQKRPLSVSAARFSQEAESTPGLVPRPPKGTDSSTSALDYKISHPQQRPPRLPRIDPPRWSAEEAVTNIL